MTYSMPVVVGWKVLIEPKRGKTQTEGGIDVSVTEQAQEHLAYIGKIVAMGEAAFSARTQGGIDMAEWKARPQVGDFVMFQPYGGMMVRPTGEQKPLRLMNDTDIVAIIDSPDDFYSWIDV